MHDQILNFSDSWLGISIILISLSMKVGIKRLFNRFVCLPFQNIFNINIQPPKLWLWRHDNLNIDSDVSKFARENVFVKVAEVQRIHSMSMHTEDCNKDIERDNRQQALCL